MAVKLLLSAALAFILGVGMVSGQQIPIEFIRVAEIDSLMQQGTMPTFVDVRSRQEYLTQHIKGALSLPLNHLDTRHRELPREGLVVLY